MAEILGYANTRQAILDHVNDEEKISRSLIVGWRAKTNENKKSCTLHTIFINENGFHSRI